MVELREPNLWIRLIRIRKITEFVFLLRMFPSARDDRPRGASTSGDEELNGASATFSGKGSFEHQKKGMFGKKLK
jgi:hypothetical protein